MKPEQTNEYDLIIVGAGMIGASLALGLSRLTKTDLRVAIVEAVEPSSSHKPSYDDRNLALSLSSQRILAAFGLWQDFLNKITPIERIHVSEQYRFAAVRMNSAMLGLPALAYVLKASDLGQGLLKQLNELSDLDFICPASVVEVKQDLSSASIVVERGGENEQLKSKLLVLADGSLSKTRDMLGFELNEKDYGQSAIVTNITPEHSHKFTAYERFNREGPLALLPISAEHCGLVFTVREEDLEMAMSIDDAEFIQVVEKRFGRRLGRFLRVGKRKSYPLRLIHAETSHKGRALLLGNSAHTIHPNMAQGFNLGLRDVAGLIEVINKMTGKKKDIGSEKCMQAYQSLRQNDQDRVIKLTDGLASIFYNDDVLKSTFRNTGLLLTDIIPGIKKQIMQTALGLNGRQPQLVRQL